MFAQFARLVREQRRDVSTMNRKSSLHLEALGDRITPTTFTVTNLNATGAGSLAAAIHHAEHDHTESHEVIVFSASLGGQTIKTADTLSISDKLASIEIDAPTEGIIISGGLSHEVFHIAAGTDVTLKGLTITHGSSDTGGGGIDNAGTLTLVKCNIVGNHAKSFGGGIENELHGHLTLRNTRVDWNDAVNGGGLDNNGKLTLIGTTLVDDNRAKSGDGGGIDNEANGKLTMLASASVTNNTAAGYGGGIFDAGIFVDNGHVSGNHSHGGQGDDVYESQGD